GRLRVSPRRSTSTVLAPGPGGPPSVTCPDGWVAIAPGFRLDGAPGSVARLVGRYPGPPALTRSTLSVVAVDQVTVTATARGRARPAPSQGRRVRLDIARRWATRAVGDGRRESFRVACRGGELALAGAFRLGETWYLGQRQAGRWRSFTLQSPATGSD